VSFPAPSWGIPSRLTIGAELNMQHLQEHDVSVELVVPQGITTTVLFSDTMFRKSNLNAGPLHSVADLQGV
jgi:hypothetical protein